MTDHKLPRYQPSGFFRPPPSCSFLLATAVGCGVAWLYQLLVRVIPFIYINLLVVAGFGFALAVGGWMAVRSGHCRNRVLALVFTLPLAGVPLAASYYWDYQHAIGTIIDSNPGATAQEIKQEMPIRRFLELKKEMGWKMKSSTMNGWVVTAVWIIEGLVVFGIVLFGVFGAVDSPYCERRNRWCEDKRYVVHGVGKADADPLLSRGSSAPWRSSSRRPTRTRR